MSTAISAEIPGMDHRTGEWNDLQSMDETGAVFHCLSGSGARHGQEKAPP
jgi:hypothetical protein